VRHARDDRPHGVSNPFLVRPVAEKDPSREAFLLTRQTEQDVLGADVVVSVRKALAEREIQHLLGAWRERDLPLGNGVALALAGHSDDLRAGSLGRDAQRLEHAPRYAVLFAKQPEQQVLGADVPVLQAARLLLRQRDDLACSTGEAIEHRRRLAMRP